VKAQTLAGRKRGVFPALIPRRGFARGRSGRRSGGGWPLTAIGRHRSGVRVDERFIEALTARRRPSDIVGRTVKPKRQGREFVGLSPFSKEKSPSFFVNDDKGFFHDFSSGKHGDVITFLQETERLSFVEAVSRLAGEAG